MNRTAARRRARVVTSGPGLRALLVIAVTAALVSMTSCTVVRSAGQTHKESRSVSGISSVELSGSGDLTIEQTGTESLTIEAGTHVLPRLTSNVSDGKLKLGVKSRTMLMSTGPIRYHLTVKDLSGVSLSGSGTITIPKITASNISFDISGSGSMTVAGSADRQQLDLSGSGRYHAAGLTSTQAVAQISGSGNATMNVSDKLDVNISGSGSVTYTGSPQVTKDISGSGKLIQK